MKRFFSFRSVLLLVLGAGIWVALSALFEESEPNYDDFEEEHPYGEPDGAVSEGNVSSFVD